MLTSLALLVKILIFTWIFSNFLYLEQICWSLASSRSRESTVLSSRLLTYLFNLIPHSIHELQTRTSSKILTYQCRIDTFKHSVFPWIVAEWNKIHPDIRNASIGKHLLKEILPDPPPVYNICKAIGLKLLTRLRLRLSHLNEHRFSHIWKLYSYSIKYVTDSNRLNGSFFKVVGDIISIYL